MNFVFMEVVFSISGDHASIHRCCVAHFPRCAQVAVVGGVLVDVELVAGAVPDSGQDRC